MKTLQEICAELELLPPGHRKHDQLQEAWADFVNDFPWQWFVTLTFRDEVHPEKAMKLFRVWIRALNYYLFGKSATRKGRSVYYVVAHEYQKRGVLHFHALIGADIALTERITFGGDKSDLGCLMYWNELWYSMAGICRVEEIKSKEAVANYISKYVIKDGQIDVSANLKYHRPGQPETLDR